jgi:hypothetical protein
METPAATESGEEPHLPEGPYYHSRIVAGPNRL